MSVPSIDSNHSRYDVLDGMRGIAAISVMIYHFAQHLNWKVSDNPSIAVDLFFMLSGFVIAHSYGARLQTNMGFFEYIMKRVIRLYPIFILGVVIGGLVLCFLVKEGLSTHSMRSVAGSMFFNSLFLPDLNGFKVQGALAEIFPIDPPLWSIFFEMLASLAFPFLFKLERASLIRFVTFSLSSFLVFSFVDAFLNYRHWVTLSGGWGASNFIVGFPRVLFGFSLGILLYLLIDDRRLTKSLAFPRRFISRPYALYFSLILVFAFPQEIWGLYPAFIIAVVAPCLVCIGAKLSCEGKISAKSAWFLGRISYPLYCLHFPIGRIVFLLADKAHYSTSFKILTSSAVTFLTSIIFTKFYDEPVRAYLSKRLSEFLQCRVQSSAVGDEEPQQKELAILRPVLVDVSRR